MRIECVFFGPIRDDVGEKSIERELGEGATLRDLLTDVQAEYPDLDVVEDDGFAGEIAVTVNKKDVRHLEGLETDLHDGDVVRVTTAVYGG